MSGPRCTHPTGPPCDRLLDDPLGTLADRDAWPGHLCPDVAQASTVRWAQARAASLYGNHVPEDVNDWIDTYPLPVGRWSLPAGLPAILAPLPGEGKAAIILAPDLPFLDVVAFGMVIDGWHVPDELGEAGDLMPVAMQVTTAGWSDRTDGFRDQACKWWATMSGLSITGRPDDTTVITNLTHVEAAYVGYHDRDGRYPNQLQLAGCLGVGESTLRRFLGTHGLSWAIFRDRMRINIT